MVLLRGQNFGSEGAAVFECVWKFSNLKLFFAAKTIGKYTLVLVLELYHLLDFYKRLFLK